MPTLRVRLGHLHHALQAFRKDPIIRLHDFAVFAIGGYQGKPKVIVLHLREERPCVNQTNSLREPAYVQLGDVVRSVSTLIVYENVLKVRVGLSQNALDTLGKVILGVVKGCHDANQRDRFHALLSIVGLMVSLGEPGQQVILPRESRSRENSLPVGGNLLHNGIPANLDAIKRIKHIFRCEILKVQKVVSLVEILHDPVHLRINGDCDSRGLRNKSQNRAVQTARDQVVDIAKHSDIGPARS